MKSRIRPLPLTQPDFSSELLATMVETAHDAVISLSLDGRIRTWCPEAERFFGYVPSEAIGKFMFFVVPERSRSGVQAALARAKQGEQIPFYETERLNKAGKVVSVSESLCPEKDEQGRVVGLSWLARDVAEGRKVQDTLRTQALILNHLAEGVNVVNTDGVITFGNSAFHRMFGYKDGELVGQHVSILNDLPEEENQRFVGKIIQALQNYGSWAGEVRNRRKDGSPFFTRAMVSSMDIDGETFYISAQEDITERREIESALIRTTEELRRSNADLEQFAYIASHDLQDPLRVARCYLELLERKFGGELNDEARYCLKTAREATLLMKQLIDSLLHYARVEISELKLERTDVTTLLRDRVLPAIGLSDRLLRVRIDCRDGGKEWIFSVQDNGRGFDESEANRLFHFFSRGQSAGISPGLGIGLAVCKRIIERHGGRIWASGKPNEGATFYFTLPKQRPF